MTEGPTRNFHTHGASLASRAPHISMIDLTTDAAAFLRKAAHLATEHLKTLDDRSRPVTQTLSPAELHKKLGLKLPEAGRELDSLLKDVSNVLKYSVRTGHPRFMNQLFGGYDPAAILGDWIAAVINTSMYTYEAAPVATLMEQILIGRMTRMVGFESGEGTFAPGGSVSNLMAVLAARQRAVPSARQTGLRGDEKLVMFVSAEGHYSLDRAAVVGGLGLDAVVKVEVDEDGRMRPDALERAMQAEVDAGRRPFLVGCTSGSTVPGAFDPLDQIGPIAKRHGAWFHVDASYGGSVLFSDEHRDLMKGVDQADSVSWNPHKMMGVPLTCSAILLREPGRLSGTFGMHAEYLFHDDPEEDPTCCDLGDMTLQCGRRVDALKLWLSWQAMGDQGFGQRVDSMFGLARDLADEIKSRKGFELTREPMGANVCFRYLPPALRNEEGKSRLEHQTRITLAVRSQMLRDGRFMVNFAMLDGAQVFRPALTNPHTTLEDLTLMLDEIERCAIEL